MSVQCLVLLKAVSDGLRTAFITLSLVFLYYVLLNPLPPFSPKCYARANCIALNCAAAMRFAIYVDCLPMSSIHPPICRASFFSCIFVVSVSGLLPGAKLFVLLYPCVTSRPMPALTIPKLFQRPLSPPFRRTARCHLQLTRLL